MLFMLDTNTCIAALKGDRRLAEPLNRHADDVCISAIALAELWYGADNSAAGHYARNRHRLEAFAARLPVLDFGGHAAGHYGSIRADLRRAGAPIGSLDMLIAAHARAESLVLVTCNVREFERVPGLRIVDWLQN